METGRLSNKTQKRRRKYVEETSSWFGLVMLARRRAEAAESALQPIADALDVSTTKTFQFTGNGTMYSLGQSTSPAAAWPRLFVKSLTRVYDFTTGDDAR